MEPVRCARQPAASSPPPPSPRVPPGPRLRRLVASHGRRPRRLFNSAFANAPARAALVTARLRPACDSLGLAQRTLYLALAVLDFCSAAAALPPRDFTALALACFCLAAKLNEPAPKLARLAPLRAAIARLGRDYAALEQSVLARVRFDLGFATPHDFLALLVEDARLYRGLRRRAVKPFVAWTSELAFRCAARYAFNRFNALALAVSVLMAGRKHFGCRSLLPEHVARASGCSEAFVGPCLREVLALAAECLRDGRLPPPRLAPRSG